MARTSELALRQQAPLASAARVTPPCVAIASRLNPSRVRKSTPVPASAAGRVSMQDAMVEYGTQLTNCHLAKIPHSDSKGRVQCGRRVKERPSVGCSRLLVRCRAGSMACQVKQSRARRRSRWPPRSRWPSRPGPTDRWTGEGMRCAVARAMVSPFLPRIRGFLYLLRLSADFNIYFASSESKSRKRRRRCAYEDSSAEQFTIYFR